MKFKTKKELAAHFGTVEAMLTINEHGSVIAPDVDGGGMNYVVIAEVIPGGFNSLVKPSEVVIPEDGKTYTNED